jgi:hypothetical protein
VISVFDVKVFKVSTELQHVNKAINTRVPYPSNTQIHIIEGNSIAELEVLINFTTTLFLAVRHHGSSYLSTNKPWAVTIRNKKPQN